MGAYNWIMVKAICPNCNKEDIIKCQTHIASSYDGDDKGRFHDQVYVLGQPMRWWNKNDERYKNWKQGNYDKTENLIENIDQECCYSNCANCNMELYVIIEFEHCIPKRVIDIGLEKNWPNKYYH